VLDGAHYLSAGAVSFARGLNDTPKIVALMVAAQAMDLRGGMVLVGLAMALGALLHARKVAETMSRKITPMNHGQGFSANLVTAALVLLASRLGLPVSTTHVSCGGLFGIGAVTRQARWKTIGSILLAWLITLPTAALISALAAKIL
jgi:PiT family inorganic phosphate transporter